MYIASRNDTIPRDCALQQRQLSTYICIFILLFIKLAIWKDIWKSKTIRWKGVKLMQTSSFYSIYIFEHLTVWFAPYSCVRLIISFHPLHNRQTLMQNSTYPLSYETKKKRKKRDKKFECSKFSLNRRYSRSGFLYTGIDNSRENSMKSGHREKSGTHIKRRTSIISI